jgi:hypothetical protein
MSSNIAAIYQKEKAGVNAAGVAIHCIFKQAMPGLKEEGGEKSK